MFDGFSSKPSTIKNMTDFLSAAHDTAQAYWEDIQSQPTHLATVLSATAHLRASLPRPQQDDMLVAVGEGSSLHALAMAAPWLGAWLGLPVQVWTPQQLCLWLARTSFGPRPAGRIFCLAASQSGETGSLLTALDTLSSIRAVCTPFILPVTVHPESTLGTTYGPGLWLPGPSDAVIPATRTVSAMLMALLCWAAPTVPNSTDAWTGVPQAMAETLANFAMADDGPAAQWTAAMLAGPPQFVLLAEPLYLPVMQEAALKLIETGRYWAMAYEVESFRHGPKVLLSGTGSGPPCVLYLLAGDWQPIIHHYQRHGRCAFDPSRCFVLHTRPPQDAPPPWLPPEQAWTLSGASGETGEMVAMFCALAALQAVSARLLLASAGSANDPALSKWIADTAHPTGMG
jgi:fructoselysine-6-P-deglycase FrlB-like protein